MKKIGILILLFVTSLAHAQNVAFWASAPDVVTEGEYFGIVYTLEGEGTWKAPDWEMMDWGGLKKVYGPRLGQSISSFPKDGSLVQCRSYTYTYLVEAVKGGVYDIEPVRVTIEGKQYISNALKIKVVGKPADEPEKDGQGIKSDTSLVIHEKNLYVETDVSRRNLYIGESLVVTMKIYSQVCLVRFGEIKFPSFTGFLTEKIPTPQLIELSSENYNGDIYDVGVIRKMLLFPQHTGEITISPFELECIVRPILKREGDSLFDVLFGNHQDVRVMRQSKPVTITVKELPSADKPAAFSGVVGTMGMSTFLSADTVYTHDTLTYKVVFSGTGNLKLLQAPSISFPLGVGSCEPKETRDIRITENGMTGTVTFEYVLIPRYSGEYKIPALHFSYFDLQSNTRLFRGKNIEYWFAA